MSDVNKTFRLYLDTTRKDPTDLVPVNLAVFSEDFDITKTQFIESGDLVYTLGEPISQGKWNEQEYYVRLVKLENGFVGRVAWGDHFTLAD